MASWKADRRLYLQDGQAVGEGRAGPLTGKLAAFYAAHMKTQEESP